MFPAGNANALAERMIEMHQMDDSRSKAFSDLSVELSKQYTPEIWAATLRDGLHRLTQAETGVV